MSEQFTVAPLGLLTQPNKLGVYPEGAMSVADSLVMRAPARLTQMRTPELWSAGSGLGFAASSVCTFPLNPGYLHVASGTGFPNATRFGLMDAAGASLGFLTPINGAFPSRARCRPFLFRGHLFIQTTTGLCVLDALDGSDLTLRWAQLPQPLVSFLSTLSGNSVDAASVVGYCAVIRRVMSDGYELISAPSPILRYWALSASAPGISVFWENNVNGGVIAGDYIDIYRTRQASAPTNNLNVNPGTTVYRIISRTITSAEATAGAIFSPNLQDLAGADEIVGDELYSNPGQETLQGIRLCPPIAQCSAEYKGTILYGNITQPGEWVTSWPGGFGYLGFTGSARVSGIGARPMSSGTFTSGNPTITAVSAADMIGIVPGQTLYDGGTRVPVSPKPTIVSVTASTITMSANALSSGAATGSFEIRDTLEIDGTQVVTFGFLESMWKEFGGFGIPITGAATTAYRWIAQEPFLYYEGLGTYTDSKTFGQGIAISPQRSAQNTNGLSVRGTNGQNYSPPIPEISATAKRFDPVVKKNILQWSWDQQPESVSPAAYTPVGSGEIYALATTRDATWIFASDGLWRLTGYGTRPSGLQANYRIDLIDRTLILAGPNAFAVLRDAVFAYTNIGLVKISDDAGVAPISRGIIGDLLPGRYWIEDDDICMAADEVLDEVWLNITSGNFDAGSGAANCFIWSDIYQVFTKLAQLNSVTPLLQSMAFDRAQGLMQMGAGQTDVSTGPRLFRHNPAVASFNAWQMDFQPQYGSEPKSTKQWGEMCVIFDPSNNGKVIVPRFNGVNYASDTLRQYANQPDSRAFFGVDIEAPAVANALAPGMSGTGPSTTQADFRGLIMNYEVISDSDVYR